MTKERNMNVQILLDNQKNQAESLISAAALARVLKVQLQGLFIEEESWLRAADLHISREVSRWTAQERYITSDRVERILRLHARQSQEVLESTALKEKVDYSFQVIRGEKINWLKENMDASEILFLGGHEYKTKSYQSYKYCRELIIPMVVLFDGSEAAEKALELAIQIAEKNDKSLLILFLLTDLLTGKMQKNQLDERLKNHPTIMISVEYIESNHVFAMLRRRKINLLIMSANMEWVQDNERLSQLIYQLNYPTLLIK